MIDVKHLSKSFGEVEVLKDINETIDKGEKVVIVGPSGSGKSTFLRCLNLMEKPTSGDIFFEGENITQANGHGFSAFQPLPTSYNKKEYHSCPCEAWPYDSR